MSDWEMRGKPALLILHMQHAIVGKGSGIRPEFAKAVRESGIIIRQQALLKAFRTRKLPAIYINVLKRPPVSGAFPAYGFIWEESKSAKPSPKDLEVIPELAPQPGEPVLVNWPISAFNNSGLDQALRICGAETLVLAGFITDGIVFSAVQGAADRCYSVIVPNDASASPSAKAHEAVMERMAPMIALVTTTQDVIAHL